MLLSTGISAELAGEPPPYEFMLALDAEDRQENPLPLIRMTARVEPEWLLDLFPDRIQERSSVVWNRITERVEKVSALLYDNLIIEESRGAAAGGRSGRVARLKGTRDRRRSFCGKAGSGIFSGSIDLRASRATRYSCKLCAICAWDFKAFGDLRSASRNFIPLLEEKLRMQTPQ